MMINTMRGRLVLSHVLPLLVMVPLMGIALIYVLETRVLLEDLSTDLMGQALLVAEIASGRGDIWTDRARAQELTTLVHSHVEARIVRPAGCRFALSASTNRRLDGGMRRSGQCADRVQPTVASRNRGRAGSCRWA
jgi:hypothetical protein